MSKEIPAFLRRLFQPSTTAVDQEMQRIIAADYIVESELAEADKQQQFDDEPEVYYVRQLLNEFAFKKVLTELKTMITSKKMINAYLCERSQLHINPPQYPDIRDLEIATTFYSARDHQNSEFENTPLRIKINCEQISKNADGTVEVTYRTQAFVASSYIDTRFGMEIPRRHIVEVTFETIDELIIGLERCLAAGSLRALIPDS